MSRADSSLGRFYPSFLRNRIVPDRHAVATDEADHDSIQEQERATVSDKIGASDLGSLLKLKRDKEEEKEEAWNRLGEMACFALSGFGFFETSLGTGAYSREKKASILRQGITDKDRYWDAGLRVPIGNRVAHAGASLSWGTILEGSQSDDALLLLDCGPYTMDAYDAFVPDAKKLEMRGNQPLTMGRFQRCAKQHTDLFCLIYGEQNRKERMDALETTASLGETQPGLFHVDFLCQ